MLLSQLDRRGIRRQVVLSHYSSNTSLQKPATPVSPSSLGFRYTQLCHEPSSPRQEGVSCKLCIQIILFEIIKLPTSSMRLGMTNEPHHAASLGATRSALYVALSGLALAILAQTIASLINGAAHGQ
jgi:hypothetical protein